MEAVTLDSLGCSMAHQVFIVLLATMFMAGNFQTGLIRLRSHGIRRFKTVFLISKYLIQLFGEDKYHDSTKILDWIAEWLSLVRRINCEIWVVGADR